MDIGILASMGMTATAVGAVALLLTRPARRWFTSGKRRDGTRL